MTSPCRRSSFLPAGKDLCSSSVARTWIEPSLNLTTHFFPFSNYLLISVVYRINALIIDNCKLQRSTKNSLPPSHHPEGHCVGLWPLSHLPFFPRPCSLPRGGSRWAPWLSVLLPPIPPISLPALFLFMSGHKPPLPSYYKKPVINTGQLLESPSYRQCIPSDCPQRPCFFSF